MLNCKAYFAKAIEKTEALKEWIEEKSCVIVDRNGLVLGIDIANIWLVLDMRGICNLLNYEQELGVEEDVREVNRTVCILLKSVYTVRQCVYC